jgi:hypothetical protein
LYRSKTRKPAIIVSNLHKILEYMTPATWVEAIEDRRQALSINYRVTATCRHQIHEREMRTVYIFNGTTQQAIGK